MPDSVYREAVTKLRILLEATEAASNAAAEAETDADKFPASKLRRDPISRSAAKMRFEEDSRKVNFIGSVDRNMDRMRIRDEEVGFQSADRRNPRFVKNRSTKLGSHIISNFYNSFLFMKIIFLNLVWHLIFCSVVCSVQ